MLWWSIRMVFLVGAVVVGVSLYAKHNTEGPAGWAAAKPREHQTAAVAVGDAPIQYSGSELSIPISRDGHFYLDVMIEGSEIPFLVDTGASGIFLNHEAADLIGIDMDELDYTIRTKTANGFGRAAPVTLGNVQVDEIYLEDVQAIVNDAPMSISLLGMSFLSRLESYEVRNGYLILRW